VVVNDELMTWNEAVETNFKVLFQYFPHVPPLPPHPHPPKVIKYSKQPIDFSIEFVIMLTVKKESFLYKHHKGVYEKWRWS
jgi:hypothetical protein